ncbi:MAG: NAD-dependent epimerase/dehydratase family protein [Bacteroidales bacterium]
MVVSVFGTNGMLSSFLSSFFSKVFSGNEVNVYGIKKPEDYLFTKFIPTDFLNDEIDWGLLIKSDLIIYAAGAGVQAAINTNPDLVYKLNLNVPLTICNTLKKNNYEGVYISFGSYMEIGLNDNDAKLFDEKEIELSSNTVSNDYALSKRLLTRFMGNLTAPYRFWHFILPNIFIKNEIGTRLIPYVLNYIKKTKNGEHSELPKLSSGNQIRQYINFEDVCYVITKCLEYKIPSGIYNIGGGEALSIKELIIRLFNYYQVPICDEMFGREVRRDGDIKSLKLNAGKLQILIGYLPHQKIESIL